MSRLFCTIFFLVIGGSVFYGCKSSESMAENEQGWKEIHKLVQDQQFEITHDWAYPQQLSRIQLFSNPNFIRVHGDSINLFLPYFGERQMGGGYNSSIAIEYEGIPDNYSVSENEEKNEITISFETSEDTETFQIRMTIFPNKNVQTFVQTTNRTSIRYQGSIDEFVPEEEKNKSE